MIDTDFVWPVEIKQELPGSCGRLSHCRSPGEIRLKFVLYN